MPPILYILQREYGFLSEKPAQILGVYSNADKATAEAQKRAGFRPKYPGYHGLNEYRVMDSTGGSIKIIQREIQGEDTGLEGGAHATIYLALEQASSSMLEIEPFTDQAVAWEACLKFRDRRGRGVMKLKDEKKWMDKNGLWHAKAKYKNMPDMLNGRHWYVGAFKVDEVNLISA